MKVAKANLSRIRRTDFRRDLVAASVKHDDFIASFQTENVAAMVSFGAGQEQRVRIPIFRRDIKAMHQRKNSRARSKKLLCNGVFSSPHRAANSSSFWRCSGFSRV